MQLAVLLVQSRVGLRSDVFLAKSLTMSQAVSKSGLMTLTCPFLLPVVVPLVREPRSNHRTWRLSYRIVRPVRIGFRSTVDGDEFSPCLGQSNHSSPSSTFFRTISRSSLARVRYPSRAPTVSARFQKKSSSGAPP